MSLTITWIAALIGGFTIGLIIQPMTGSEFVLTGILGFGWGFICSIIRRAIIHPWPDN